MGAKGPRPLGYVANQHRTRAVENLEAGLAAIRRAYVVIYENPEQARFEVQDIEIAIMRALRELDRIPREDE